MQNIDCVFGRFMCKIGHAMKPTHSAMKRHHPAKGQSSANQHFNALDADQATVRAMFLVPFVQELERSNVDADAYLRKFGFSGALLANLYEHVPLRQYIALTEDLSQRLERPYLGLELGQQFRLADFGPFYALFTLAHDLGAALERYARFQWAWQTHTSLEVVPGPTTTVYRYCIQDPSIWPRTQDAEYAVVSLCAMIRQLLDPHWRPVEVEFEHDVSLRRNRLSRYFGARASGGGVSNAIIVTNRDLRQPLRWRMSPHDATTLPVLERHLLNLLHEESAPSRSCAESTAIQVARRLGRAPVTIDAIAKDLNLSVRTLRRKLAAENTSFRSILQGQRLSRLEGIMASGARPLAALAFRLNYSDPSVLSRAFKTWTGETLTRRRRKSVRSA